MDEPRFNSFVELDAARDLADARALHSDLVVYRREHGAGLREVEQALIDGQIRDARNAIIRALRTIRAERMG